MSGTSYQDRIEYLKCSVAKMLLERDEHSQRAGDQAPSPACLDATHILRYAMNLSAADFLNIRFHTGLLTAEHIYNYWHVSPPLNPEIYAEDSGYKFYTENVPQAYWVGDPPIPAAPIPLGVNYKGKIINKPTVRYQACISNLYMMGILPDFLEQKDHSIVLEIGAGHGGFAHALGNILTGRSTHIIVDLPEVLLLSGGFLTVNNPGKNIYVYEKSTFTPEFVGRRIRNYDYVLVPNYAVQDLYALPEIDLMVDVLSFPEMTGRQVTEYLELGLAKLSGYLCSYNWDHHAFKDELAPDTLTTMLDRHFQLFPPPELYEQAAGENGRVTKLYFGIARNSERHFSAEGRVKHIVGGERFMFCFSRQPAPL